MNYDERVKISNQATELLELLHNLLSNIDSEKIDPDLLSKISYSCYYLGSILLDTDEDKNDQLYIGI